jgi:hypothetical protein
MGGYVKYCQINVLAAEFVLYYLLTHSFLKVLNVFARFA